MFKDEYKKVYDKIEGDKTQIAKILAVANSSEPAKKKFVFPFKFGTAFAALLVIGISIYSLPQMQDINEPIENKESTKTEKRVVQDAAFGTVYTDDIENQPENHPVENKKSSNVPKSENVPVNNETPKTEETSADNVAEAASEDVPTVGTYNMRGVTRSVNTNVVSQYTVEFPETVGFASVTVYNENQEIEQAFINQDTISYLDMLVILSGDETDKQALVKLNHGYAEIYAQNITEQQLLDLIANISM